MLLFICAIGFQQDGAICYTAMKQTMNVRHGMFGNVIISRQAALTWPPRSPDLNATNYYFRRDLKERVYINIPKNLEDLKDNIKREIRAISPATLRSMTNYALVRACSCDVVEEQHLGDIIFSR